MVVKKTISARVSTDLVESVKKNNVSISTIISASLFAYAKMTGKERVEFLIKNSELYQDNIKFSTTNEDFMDALKKEMLLVMDEEMVNKFIKDPNLIDTIFIVLAGAQKYKAES